MKTKSKVKSVQANGTWDANDGTTYYKFDYEMEDGAELQASHKKPENHFPAGSEVEYEIKRTHETYGNSGSVSKLSDFQQGGQGKNNADYVKGIEVGHAVNNAVNMICAGVEFKNVPSDLPTGQKIEAYAQNIMQIANKLKSA